MNYTQNIKWDGTLIKAGTYIWWNKYYNMNPNSGGSGGYKPPNWTRADYFLKRAKTDLSGTWENNPDNAPDLWENVEG